jgi:hypothetical protein
LLSSRRFLAAAGTFHPRHRRFFRHCRHSPPPTPALFSPSPALSTPDAGAFFAIAGTFHPRRRRFFRHRRHFPPPTPALFSPLPALTTADAGVFFAAAGTCHLRRRHFPPATTPLSSGVERLPARVYPARAASDAGVVSFTHDKE